MPSPKGSRLGIAQALIIALITLYRYTLAAFLGGRCRYEPSCSQYGLIAVRHHGALRGVAMTLSRIGRCHPWGGAGHDPVPGASGEPAYGVAPSRGARR